MRYYLGAAVAALLLAGPAAAGVTVVEFASGGGNQGNVIFKNCSSGTVGSGELLGCLNGNPDALVRFASSGDSLFSPSGGQARIKAQDGAFDDLTIDFLDSGHFFDRLVLNIMALANGTVTFDGQTFDLSKNGNNFFTLTFDTAVNLFSFTTSTDVIADVRQVRIRQANGGGLPVPEPAVAGLLGLAIAGLGLARRRRA